MRWLVPTQVRKHNVRYVRYLLKYIRKGRLVACMQGDAGAGKTRAAYWVTERQSRGAVHGHSYVGASRVY